MSDGIVLYSNGWKVLPYIVFKHKTFPAREDFLKNVVVRVHENGQMSSAMVEY